MSMTTAESNIRPTLAAKRHWTVASVFDNARERGWMKQGWKPFSDAIKAKTGMHIPPGTLKYWDGGRSEPKISELEAMAAAVELELDLFPEERVRN